MLGYKPCLSLLPWTCAVGQLARLSSCFCSRMFTLFSLLHSRLIKTFLGDTFMSFSSSHHIFLNKVSSRFTSDIVSTVFSLSPAKISFLRADSRQRAVFLLSPAHGGGVTGDFNQMLLWGRIYDAGGKKKKKKRIFFDPGITRWRRMSMLGHKKGNAQ